MNKVTVFSEKALFPYMKVNKHELYVPILANSNAYATNNTRLIDEKGGLHIGRIISGKFRESTFVLPEKSGYSPDDFDYIFNMNSEVVKKLGTVSIKYFQYQNGKYHLECWDKQGHINEINLRKLK